MTLSPSAKLLIPDHVSPTSVLKVGRSRPLTVALAAMLIDHLAFAIRRAAIAGNEHSAVSESALRLRKKVETVELWSKLGREPSESELRDRLEQVEADDAKLFRYVRYAGYPPRSKLDERLKTIEALTKRVRSKDARKRVMHEIADPIIFGLLANGDPENEVALSPLFWPRKLAGKRLAMLRPLNLAAVGRLAAEARKRLAARRGRGKFYPAPGAGPNEFEYCALIVSTAWHKEKGDWPGPRSQTAFIVCELLWCAAGGVPHDGFKYHNEMSAWREHLRAVQHYRPPHRAGVRVKRMVDDAFDDALAALLPAQRRKSQRRKPPAAELSRWYGHPGKREEGRSP
jgi:hypothetical protein